MGAIAIVAIVVSVITLLVTTVVNIELKFAKSAAEAYTGVRRRLIRVLIRVLQAVSGLWIVVSVIWESVKPGPPTRASVLIVAFGVGGLVFWFIAGFLRDIIGLIGRMTDIQKGHEDAIRGVTGTVGRVIGLIERDQEQGKTD